jgi:hypothetical protein
MLLTFLQQIPTLLQAAGSAIQILTTSKTPDPSETTSSDDELDSEETTDSAALKARKANFKAHTETFYETLHAIRTTMLAQVTALENADLILTEASKVTEYGSGITNAGLGGLDIGYLNSRVRDVGLSKERELVKEARELVEGMVEKEKDKVTSDS